MPFSETSSSLRAVAQWLASGRADRASNVMLLAGVNGELMVTLRGNNRTSDVHISRPMGAEPDPGPGIPSHHGEAVARSLDRAMERLFDELGRFRVLGVLGRTGVVPVHTYRVEGDDLSTLGDAQRLAALAVLAHDIEHAEIWDTGHGPQGILIERVTKPKSA